MRKAIVRDSDGFVLNVVEHDERTDASGWRPPDGTTLVDATDEAEPGGSYAKDAGFGRAAPQEIPRDPVADKLVRIAALEAALIEKGAVTAAEIDAKAAIEVAAERVG